MESYNTWTEFYQEFANKLLTYKNKLPELIDIVKKVHMNSGLKLPTLENNNNLTEIDPFTIYGLFNKGITDTNRITIISEFAKFFNIKSTIPTSFQGVPVLNNMKATYYWFGDGRQVNDIRNLWDFFESAIAYADDINEQTEHIFINYFNEVIKQKGVKWNLTIGLFWIRPYVFLNLDGVTRAFISNMKNGLDDTLSIFPNKSATYFPSGEQYLQLSLSCKQLISENQFAFKNFPELSYAAWTDKTTIPLEDISDWYPLYYSPGISEETWLNLLNNPNIFTVESLQVMARLKEFKGIATCSELSEKFGETWNFYNVISQHLAKRVAKETNCPVDVREDGKPRWWSLLYVGKDARPDQKGSYVWKVRDELLAALENVDLSHIELYAAKAFKTRYWLFAPGQQARLWEEFFTKNIVGIGWDSLGNLYDYTSRENIKEALQQHQQSDSSFKFDTLTIWQFVNEMQIGDIIYAKKGTETIIGRGVIESEYVYDDSRTEYKNTRKVRWTHKGKYNSPKKMAQKTLTDITQSTELIEQLEELLLGEEIEIESNIAPHPYGKEKFLSEVYMDEESYETVKCLLLRKKNIILQGAPGVGKTFAAKRLAYAIMGEKDDNRVNMLQFHQSYSYEDFIMGFRPDEKHFTLVHGTFYKFCKKAQDDIERNYFFIIDEINRGNLSKIFGELFLLLEHDKRDESNAIQLLYEKEQFYIPSNVHIIGMMNTADRSLAMLDYALRRRFAFYELLPAFTSEGFRNYQKNIANEKFDRLIVEVQQLNIAIKDDESLGRGFSIGHSYFIHDSNTFLGNELLHTVVNYELIPLLEEYWFDETEKIQEWAIRLRKAIA